LRVSNAPHITARVPSPSHTRSIVMPTPSSPARPRATRRSRLLAGALAAGLLSTLPSAASAQLVQWSTAGGGNGHWYQYVSATSIFAPVSFGTALAAAQSSTHLGLQGYLATVTSQAEQDFLNGAFSYLFGFGAVSTTWLGASDADVEGEWRWLGGPEAGQLASYTNWLPGHPIGGDDFDLMALYIGAASTPATFGWASLRSTDGALGYLIEYSGTSVPTVPEPAAGALLLAGLAAFVVVSRRRRMA